MLRPEGGQSAGLEARYRELMSRSDGDINDHVLAQLLASWSSGGTALPIFLGLGQDGFNRLIRNHFPGAEFRAPTSLRLDPERLEEIDDLRRLMYESRAGHCDSEATMAKIVAIACMGMDHLWQDLGLWSRTELSELMQRNFPALAARNSRDMKWKKFLYKQLCEQEGIYVCRAPSCDVCADFNVCFGPED